MNFSLFLHRLLVKLYILTTTISFFFPNYTKMSEKKKKSKGVTLPIKTTEDRKPYWTTDINIILDDKKQMEETLPKGIQRWEHSVHPAEPLNGSAYWKWCWWEGTGLKSGGHRKTKQMDGQIPNSPCLHLLSTQQYLHPPGGRQRGPGLGCTKHTGNLR